MKAIALNSIEYIDPKTGKKTEAKPGHMFDVPKGQEVALADVIREPTEAEVALYEKQNPIIEQKAPAAVVKAPAAATGEDASANKGTSQAAAATDTTGSSDEGKTTETASTESAQKPVKPAKAPAKKRGEDLA